METQETTQEAKLDIKPSPAKRKFTLGPHELEAEEKHIFRHHVFVPDGVEFKDLFEPAAWTHVANKLRPMSRITVTSESNKFVGELVVIACDRLWAKVEEIFYKEFNVAATIDTNNEFETRWLGNRWKFGVVRLSDNETMVKELPDQAAANVALANYTSEFKRAI